mgnify:CR=1 FL=1
MARTTIADGFHILPGMGNCLAAETDVGIVVADGGPVGVAPKMIAHLRTVSDSPVHAICYSHGHNSYNAGVEAWLEHSSERGDPPPRLVAHANVVARYARYRETNGLQARMAAVQFPGANGGPIEVFDEVFLHVDPTETFDDQLLLVEGSRPVEVHWAPSETDDAIALWFPKERLLYGGPATPADSIPNVGTPLRTQRFTIRWADTLDRLAAFDAETLITEFGPVVTGAEAVRERLTMTAKALRWLRKEVVDRMNLGMSEMEVLCDLDYPPELFDYPWMAPTYGCPDYIARDLYREENGWWDRNPTSLHPAPPDEATSVMFEALTEPAAVLARARDLAESGETQLALHVIDLVAMAAVDHPLVLEARFLKAELCRTRADEVEPFVSKSCYLTSARLLDEGKTSWQDLP